MKKAIFVKDGDYTNVIYQTIQDGHYSDALIILRDQLTRNPQSRACLSLLAYCYFHTQEFSSAANCYEQLCKLHPQETHYRLYHAYSQYQANNYEKALRIVSSIDQADQQKKVTKLKAAIKYGEGDLKSTRSFLDSIEDRDPDLIINTACILYKEGNYRESLQKFTAALSAEGYNPHLSYNMALCYYRLKEFASALKHIADIIERGIRDHPELSVGMATEGIGVASVGNTLILHETALIEAFNLKAAIEYQLNNMEAAKEALTDMPPRSEEELDAVTLHNQALINMQERPGEGFEKLLFLLQQDTFPPETFSNLLLLYCKYEYFNLAADILADNSHLTNEYLTPYLYGFIDALVTKQNRPEDAYKKLEELAERHTEALRKTTKQVQEARANQDDDAIKKAVADYEESLEKYIPVLMAQAKIFWDLEQYNQVENIFHKSVEFCNENDTWRLHVANVLFMQDNKYKEATGFYEPIVKKYYNNLLGLAPIVLANLCVSYIMSSMNEEAEELMRRIEKEEERLRYEEPSRKVFHLSTVNLVIGTLYCAKGNYDFGINRLIWSLEPFDRKLGTETWFYAKRCILSLIENLAKRTLMASESLLKECVQFMEKCEAFGNHITTTIQSPLEEYDVANGKNTVTYEARLLKALLLSVNEI